MTPGSIRATAAAFMLTAIAGSATAQERAFDFALVGDMPYTKVQEVEYQRVLAALNAADLAFVAHIGDFQFDATPYNRNPARLDAVRRRKLQSRLRLVPEHPPRIHPDAWRQRLVRLLAARGQKSRSARAARQDPHDVLSGRQKPWAEADRGA